MTPTPDLAKTYLRLQKELRLARKEQHRAQELTALRELAQLEWDYDDLVGAESRFQEALVCAIALKRIDLQCDLLCRLGKLEAVRGRPEVAVTHFKCILERSGPDETDLLRGEALLEIGTLLLADRQPVVARAWLEEALINFQKNRSPELEVRARLKLAELYFSTANLDAAENESRKALLLAVECGARVLAIAARLRLGNWIALRSSTLGNGLLLDSLRESQEQGLLDLEQECQLALARAHQHDSAWELASKAFEAAVACAARRAAQQATRQQEYVQTLRSLESGTVQRAPARGATVTRYDVTSSHELLHALLLDAALVGGSFAVALVDIDHFRQIRHQFGPSVSERVLARATELMVQSLRGGDTLAHHAGPEYVAALPGASPRQARAIAERLRQSVMAADWGAIQPGLSVTLSIGVCIGSSGTDPNAVFQAADRSLEEARSAGHNRVEVSHAG